jgi:hypothetical protein
MTTSIYRDVIVLSILAAVSTGTAAAQPQQPKLREVYFSTVKPDRIGDFLAAGREIADAMKKGDSERSYTVWTSLSGPREYLLVRYHSTWAELDTPLEPKLNGMGGQLALITARINAAVESQRRVMYLLDHDLSLPIGDAPPAMVQVLRTWVRPEHIQAYRDLVKSETLPAIKKGGAKMYSVSHVRAGGANQEYSSVIALDNWAALDGVMPIVTGLGGQAGYDKFLTKLRPLITRSEYEIYRYLPNLSYLAPRK